MRAIVNGTVIAESDDTVVVEGNHYFPPESMNSEYFSPTSHSTVCHWKGTAAYYDVNVNGESLNNVAWYYPQPKAQADHIRDYVAFYPKVTVEA